MVIALKSLAVTISVVGGLMGGAWLVVHYPAVAGLTLLIGFSVFVFGLAYMYFWDTSRS